MHVHQFHPTPTFGDAISNHLISLQHLLRVQGFESEIFCDQPPLHFEGQTYTIDEYDRYTRGPGVLICHFSLSYSDRVMSWLQQNADRKVLLYHNITPHTFFVGINQVCFESSQRGRRQLRELCGMADALWADSTYNAQEIADWGYESVEVLPITFDPDNYAVRPSVTISKRYRGGFNVLHVGRVSPNKRLQDLILAFYHLKRTIRPDARLLLVGSAGGMQPYLEYLQELISRLALQDVVLAGHVSTSELVAFYRVADLYLCMSEHEGFCVPLLESMHFGVPIVAYRSSAIPGTLGGSGVLVTEKDFASVAELIGLLSNDAALRSQVIERQRERLKALAPSVIAERLQELLAALDV